jgi:hypothetical protein
MNKTSLSILILLSLLTAPALANEDEEKAPNPLTAIKWVGKHRDEVVKLLGEPVKSKKTGKGETLIFHGPMEWFADPSELRHRHGKVAVDPESKRPITIGIVTESDAPSPADEYQVVSDSEGNPLGAFGRPMLSPGTGGVSVHRLKLFLDENGYVYKTKIGKRLAK